MQAMPQDNTIVLTRSAPDTSAGRAGVERVVDLLERVTGEIVVFFHGDGVMQASAPYSDRWRRIQAPRLSLEVCSAAWQRRTDDTLDEPFERSSLVWFWHRLARGFRFDDEQGAGVGAGPWVVIVASAPTDPDSQEVLELVLAGASLELPIAVLFSGAGCEHLVGEKVRAWRQLVDFSLADVFYCGATRVPDIEAVALEPARVHALLEGSRGAIRL
ncbi:DsrE family protein [Wenzhouxiangella sp. AB-CW3]|uniref:DsrE family protein n=1 Tax=Wenzhouxiangella sp. AB-CW3 TaxID=2771012 RepID=UPI00168B26C5|nr:DsrE family protein [Wenzhouxiangella sp. AB-CW3]QOC23585.1 DsrE family protein [Wenzhouxiangella sp. AB-CW3]